MEVLLLSCPWQLSAPYALFKISLQDFGRFALAHAAVSALFKCSVALTN